MIGGNNVNNVGPSDSTIGGKISVIGSNVVIIKIVKINGSSDNIVSVNIEINNIDSKTVNCSVNCSVINKISSNVNNFSGNNVVNITFFLDQM